MSDFIPSYKKENGSQSISQWKWKPTKSKRRMNDEASVSQFIEDNRRKVEEAVVGPGAGAGIGCGIGVGFGLVGGIGYGDTGWNSWKMVFGAGLGCGVGVGFGYGNGIGIGSSFESLRARLSKPKPVSKRGILSSI